MQNTPQKYNPPPGWTTQKLPFMICSVGLILPLLPICALILVGKGMSAETAGMLMLLSLGLMIFLLLVSIACVPLRVILLRQWLSKQPALTLDDLLSQYHGWIFFQPREEDNGLFMMRLLSDEPTGESRDVRIDKEAADELKKFFDPSYRRLGTTVTKKNDNSQA